MSHLYEVILHDIPDDAELIKVSSASFGPKGFLEGNLNIADVLVIPYGPQKSICKSQYQHILHELFAQIMVNSAFKRDS